jgi:cleavage and polyadenylation specificity factor subunit 1
MPHIHDLAQSFSGCNVFSLLDLKKAFYQVRMAEEDIPKTAITTPFGSFCFRYMPFGLRNASQTFQRCMDFILRDMPFARCYIDDIIIGSHDIESHFCHLQLILDKLKEYSMRVSLQKCKFFMRSVVYLGHEISGDGVKPVAQRVAAVAEIPPPNDVQSLRRFLGMVGFYHRHIEHYSHHAAPLTDLLKSNVPFVWSDKCQRAFETLKRALAERTLLVHQNPDATLVLTTDASGQAAGACLSQEANGNLEPLAFYSKKFSERESSKSAFDRELLAMYLAVEHFEWLSGHPFVIRTDHKPLTRIFCMKKPTPQQRRWISYLSEFHCTIQFIAGRDNVVADTLSRSVCTIFNRNQSDFAQQQAEDAELQHFFQSTKLPLKRKSFNGGIVVCDKKNRPFVPSNLRHSLIEQTHSLHHPGIRATQRLIAERYVWPRMNTDVRDFVRACKDCQESKVCRHTKTPVETIPTVSRFHTIHSDLVGPLPPCQGYRYLLTIIDRFTNWIEAVPLRSISAESVARALITVWISRFGVPTALVTDQGTQFTSVVWSMLMCRLGIEHRRTSTYHPQCNGLIERSHRCIKDALRCRLQGNNWVEELPVILLGLRSTIGVHGFAPAEAVYGTHLCLPSDYFPPTEPEPNDMPAFLEKLFSKMRTFAPPKRSHSTANYVPNFNTTHAWLRKPSTTSLQRPYSGPYPIVFQDAKTITLRIEDSEVRVSKDRTKPAHMLPESANVSAVSSPKPCLKSPFTNTRKPRRRVRFYTRSTLIGGGNVM